MYKAHTCFCKGDGQYDVYRGMLQGYQTWNPSSRPRMQRWQGRIQEELDVLSAGMPGGGSLLQASSVVSYLQQKVIQPKHGMTWGRDQRELRWPLSSADSGKGWLQKRRTSWLPGSCNRNLDVGRQLVCGPAPRACRAGDVRSDLPRHLLWTWKHAATAACFWQADLPG